MLEQMKLHHIIKVAQSAGEEILKVYETEFEVENKADQSPLTLADKNSHQTITRGLKQYYPDIPVLSEEGKEQDYAVRSSWEYVWLVDPLDGTKEFIKRNGEFTVNIALVHRGQSVAGVIYAPVLDVVYFARKGLGAYRLERLKELTIDNDEELIKRSTKLPDINSGTALRVIASRSHLSPETKQYIEEIENQHERVEIVSAGSSLKLCRIAEGAADLYPRFAPTMEWDTAAGQIIVEEAGGQITTVNTNEKLVYNKEDLINPWFIAKRG